MNELELKHAWAAGFFDGEGTIQIIGKGYRRNPHELTIHLQYQLVIAITQKDYRPVKKFMELFGGSLLIHQHPHKGYQLHRITLVANKAKKALECMLPYLAYKKDQAVLALEFQEGMNLWRGTATTGRCLPGHVIAERIEYKRRISELIATFVCAAAETKPTGTPHESDAIVRTVPNGKGTEGAEMPPRQVN